MRAPPNIHHPYGLSPAAQTAPPAPSTPTMIGAMIGLTQQAVATAASALAATPVDGAVMAPVASGCDLVNASPPPSEDRSRCGSLGGFRTSDRSRLRTP